MTHRRSSLDLTFYSAWITRAMEICVGFQPAASTALSAWTRLGPNGLELCPPPRKINLPRIVLGHLFAADVFGRENEVPLYYIQIIQGNSDGVRPLISSSKQELIDSTYAAAYAGYSTMFIGAICQSARTRLLTLCSSFASPPPWKPVWSYMNRTSAREAQAMVMEEPMQIALIY